MEKVNEVFFSEKGLTSTSASHLADLAQETILGNETKLKNISFITTKVDIVGSLSESGYCRLTLRKRKDSQLRL
jgi:hypothetical protein